MEPTTSIAELVISGIFAAVGIILTYLLVVWTRRQTKTGSASLMLGIIESRMDRHDTIFEDLNNDTVNIDDMQTELDIYNLLNDFELIIPYIDDGVIQKKHFDNAFSDSLERIKYNKSIMKIINKQKKGVYEHIKNYIENRLE